MTLIDFLNYLQFAIVGFAIVYTIREMAPRIGKASGPIVASNRLLSSNSLETLVSGEAGGYKYKFMASGSAHMTVFVQLNKNSRMHIVATGDKGGTDSLVRHMLKKSGLAKVELEGDFPSYFTMYCTKGRETDLTRLFDPADMARFIDFCRAYDFELFHDAIYISQAAGKFDEHDTTTLISDVETFLNKNRTTLERLESGPHKSE